MNRPEPSFEETVRAAIRRMWIRQAAWFIASATIWTGGYAIADASSGPAAVILHGLALLFGGLGTFYFAAALIGFRGEARRALHDLPGYWDRPAEFRQAHSTIFRIPWGFRLRG